MLLMALGIMAGFTACEEPGGSGSGSGSTSGGFAPDNPVNKEFRLYATSGSGRWSVKMLPGLSNGDGLVQVNSTTALIQDQKVWYSKTGRNTADLSCMFNAMRWLPSGTYGTFYQYDVQLTFTTAHQGTYKGTCTTGSIGALKEEPIQGLFAYDTDEAPAPSTDTDNPDSGDDGGTELGVVMSTPVVTDVTATSATVESSLIYGADVVLESGLCYGTQADPTVLSGRVVKMDFPIQTTVNNLMADTEYYIRAYARTANGMAYSTASRFTTQSGSGGENVSTLVQTRVSKVEIFPGNYEGQRICLNSVFTRDITGDKPVVRYCASTSPHPTIADITTTDPAHIAPDVINPIFVSEPGTVYYIRPFSISNGTVTYYDEVSVETMGGDISMSVSVSDDHIGTFVYEIRSEGAYQVRWGASGTIIMTPQEMGFITKGSGKMTFGKGSLDNDYVWNRYYYGYVYMSKVEQDAITYQYNFKMGKWQD